MWFAHAQYKSVLSSKTAISSLCIRSRFVYDTSVAYLNVSVRFRRSRAPIYLHAPPEDTTTFNTSLSAEKAPLLGVLERESKTTKDSSGKNIVALVYASSISRFALLRVGALSPWARNSPEFTGNEHKRHIMLLRLTSWLRIRHRFLRCDHLPQRYYYFVVCMLWPYVAYIDTLLGLWDVQLRRCVTRHCPHKRPLYEVHLNANGKLMKIRQEKMLCLYVNIVTMLLKKKKKTSKYRLMLHKFNAW